MKLSTLFVAQPFRRLGIAHRLLAGMTDRWLREELDYVNVTADRLRSVELFPVLSKFGFRHEALENGRYGSERDEVVFGWRPEEVNPPMTLDKSRSRASIISLNNLRLSA